MSGGGPAGSVAGGGGATATGGGAPGPWDPGQYHKFSDHRTRPAVELLGRVPPIEPALAVDLGCGSGEHTRLIAERWPGAAVQGIDNSPEMLARARAADDGNGGTADDGGRTGRAPAIEWLEADIASWTPPSPPGLVFANAALQWVDGHEALFPRLLGCLAAGGALAVQMPLSRKSPSHLLMSETLASGGPGGAPIGPEPLRREVARRWVLDAPEYYDLLAPHAATLDVWETEYLQVLRGDDPVLEWVSGTGLRPILNGLAGEERERFLGAYRRALRRTYPARPDGTTLYPFRRLFIVATRRAGA